MNQKKMGLYVHIPFCLKKCFYCDFPSLGGHSNLFEAYTRALVREIAEQGANFCDYEVDTVFIGGGTPTVLPARQLIIICEAISQSFSLSKGCEWTSEANPGTVQDSLLRSLRTVGVNRLSFGVQSFNDAILAGIGRIHSAKEAVFLVEEAARAGFDHISIDLMTGLPGQTTQILQKSLEIAAALPIQHVSLYGLKIEEGTLFAEWQSQGNLALPTDEEGAHMDELALNYLTSQGFDRYEISNYAKAGYACRHNLKYWHYEPYLGLGAAAASFFSGRRWSNETDSSRYIAAIETGRTPVAFMEELDLPTAKAEFAFLALRTMAGLNLFDYKQFFGNCFAEDYHSVVKNLQAQGLIHVTEETICLTEQGKKFGNVVFCAFLP